MSITPRTLKEQKLLKKSGSITAHALKKGLEVATVGANLLEIERVVEEEIKRLGGESSFKTVPGYHWTTCLTINNEVVHGVPRDYVLKEGDVLSIDLGAIYEGWHTDAAWSVLVESRESRVENREKKRFLQIGEEAMWAGLKQALMGNRIGDIGAAMQMVVEKKGGYRVVRTLVGHGIGRELHEEPEVPGFGEKHTGIVLKEGMSLAIEAIYTESSYDVKLAPDKWTYVSADGSLGAMFEMSVIVGKKSALVLTDWRSL